MNFFSEYLPNIVYLISSVLFILGIKFLSSPKTARKGNLFASTAMFLAIIVTLLNKKIVTYEFIIAGIILGSIIGALIAIKVNMTAMPQMVGLLNGFGGAASALVALAEYYYLMPPIPAALSVSIFLSLLIGGVTFSGSMVAFGKLQGIVT